MEVRYCKWCKKSHPDTAKGFREELLCERMGLWNAIQSEASPSKRKEYTQRYSLTVYTIDLLERRERREYA